MTSLKRKKYQRAMNKRIREINKSIEKDWLWNGRFKISQIDAAFYPYEDHSGALFKVMLKCVDRKTGATEYTIVDNYDVNWKLGRWVNKCITESFKVWDEKPNPNEQARAEGRCPKGEK